MIVLDSCHFSIHRGSTYWSPGYGIMLMAVARVSIIAFMADLWIVGYSIAFVVYGGALVREASQFELIYLEFGPTRHGSACCWRHLLLLKLKVKSGVGGYIVILGVGDLPCLHGRWYAAERAAVR